jgi:hypothetical protein
MRQQPAIAPTLGRVVFLYPGVWQAGFTIRAVGRISRAVRRSSLQTRFQTTVRVGDKNGIGAAVTRRPLPHHRAYGSVHGGSSWLRRHLLE